MLGQKELKIAAVLLLICFVCITSYVAYSIGVNSGQKNIHAFVEQTVTAGLKATNTVFQATTESPEQLDKRGMQANCLIINDSYQVNPANQTGPTVKIFRGANYTGGCLELFPGDYNLQDLDAQIGDITKTTFNKSVESIWMQGYPACPKNLGILYIKVLNTGKNPGDVQHSYPNIANIGGGTFTHNVTDIHVETRQGTPCAN